MATPVLSGGSLSPVSITSPKSQQHATALLTEVFSSFQGEGPYVGERQLFVRFSHCHLKCTYCDTAMQQSHGQCVVHGGLETSSQARVMENPFNTAKFVELVQHEWVKAAHGHVSLTGGEPLLYHRLLAEALPHLVPGIPVYLETSGTQPEFLAPIAPWVNVVAMDIKLPSATGERFYVDEHSEFLQIALAHGCETFIKLVMNDAVTDEEIHTVVEILGAAKVNVPVFIQPESHAEAPIVNLSQARLFTVAEMLSRVGYTVRVVPQTHKMLNVL